MIFCLFSKDAAEYPIKKNIECSIIICPTKLLSTKEEIFRENCNRITAIIEINSASNFNRGCVLLFADSILLFVIGE